MPRSRPRKVRRMTAPEITAPKTSNRSRVRVKMAEDENQQQAKDNPFSFNTFVSRGSQNFDEVDDKNRSNETKNAHSRYSYQEKSKSAKMDLFAEEEEEEEDEDDNPFSFKEFIKKDKRGGMYISEEDESDEVGEDMGNQNGTVSPSTQPGTSVDGRPNQRRATSPGLPSRHKHKPAAKVPPSEPAAEVATPPPTPQKTKRRQQGGKAPGQTEGDFVDFIYDYATQDSNNGDLEAGKVASSSGQRKVRNGERYSFGDTDAPALPEKKLYARERARAHTHGHAVRKHKNGPPKPHPKSQLVVDYIDATGDDVSMFSAVSASELHTVRGNDSDPILLDGLTRPKAQTDVKPHRERARAHSHGYRKQKSGEKQSKTKSSADQQTDREAKNGNVQRPDYERKPSPPRKDASEYDQQRGGGGGGGPVKSHSVPDILAEPYDTLPPRNHSPSSAGSSSMSTSPTEDGGPSELASSSPDVARLKQDYSRLRSELSESRRINDRDAKRIDTMEEELKRLRLREAEDAKTLEAMVQHVEANLKRTTERAVSAENTIATLKKEIKVLKSENSTLVSENKKFKEGKDILELRERAHTASLKLAGAAKGAESNLKQLMAGVDVLKLMAETLACFDKLSEHTDGGRPGWKGYGTAL